MNPLLDCTQLSVQRWIQYTRLPERKIDPIQQIIVHTLFVLPVIHRCSGVLCCAVFDVMCGVRQRELIDTLYSSYDWTTSSSKSSGQQQSTYHHRFLFYRFPQKQLIFLICNHLPSSAFFIDPQLKFLEKHLILISGIVTYFGGNANNVITFLRIAFKVWESHDGRQSSDSDQIKCIFSTFHQFIICLA